MTSRYYCIPILLLLLSSCGSSVSSSVDVPTTENIETQSVVHSLENPITPEPQPTKSNAMSLILKGKVNGKEWEGKSIMNPPPYYKYGSRMMMSPDMPIFKMSFWQDSDSSSVNFDLKGELKVGVYVDDSLYLNFSGNMGTTESKPGDNIRVEITSYSEEGNKAIISGKITGSISDSSHGITNLDLEWKDAHIDVWGMEAK